MEVSSSRIEGSRTDCNGRNQMRMSKQKTEIDQRFCKRCGQLLEQDWRFCEACGAEATANESTSRICLACGSSISQQARFCSYCGVSDRPVSHRESSAVAPAASLQFGKIGKWLIVLSLFIVFGYGMDAVEGLRKNDLVPLTVAISLTVLVAFVAKRVGRKFRL